LLRQYSLPKYYQISKTFGKWWGKIYGEREKFIPNVRQWGILFPVLVFLVFDKKTKENIFEQKN
ncbi:MAG: hypothetical protein AB4058_15850, partial [Microcystaceae cyanobacterium]